MVGGKQLRDDHALLEYSIKNDSTLHLSLRLKGGHDASVGLGATRQVVWCWVIEWHGLLGMGASRSLGNPSGIHITVNNDELRHLLGISLYNEVLNLCVCEELQTSETQE